VYANVALPLLLGKITSQNVVVATNARRILLTRLRLLENIIVRRVRVLRPLWVKLQERIRLLPPPHGAVMAKGQDNGCRPAVHKHCLATVHAHLQHRRRLQE
jgi:hypothetical protein